MNKIIGRSLRIFVLGALLVEPAIVCGQTRQRNVTEEANNQSPRERMLVPFMEGTDVFLTSPTDTIFEARIAPHLIVKQTFGDVLDLPAQQARVAGGKEAKHFGWVITGTPAVRIRMLRQVSNPVRTPSYMPRVNVQLLLYATGVHEKVKEHTGLAARGSAPEIGVYEFHGIVGHHSNGQDGCLYVTQARIGNAEDCTPGLTPDASKAQQIINRHDGSFSTNYVRTGLNYRRTRVDSETLVDDQDWTAGLELEQNFNMDPNVFPLYGRTRLTASAGFAGRPSGKSDHWWDREHWWTCDARREIKGSLKYIIGNPTTVWPIVLIAEADCFPSTEGGWGFFVRYYAGQDYYNLGFLDNIHRWQAGATFTQDGFFRFRRALGN